MGAGMGEDETSGCLIMSVWMEMEDLSCTSLKLKDIHVHVFHLLLSLMYWDKGVDFDKLHKCIQTKKNCFRTDAL